MSVTDNCGRSRTVDCGSCYEIRTGTVFHRSTGLEWQREVGASGRLWASAKTECQGLPLAGGGWRLPTKAELMGIVDHSRTYPAIDVVAFPNTPSEQFWTSSLDQTPAGSTGRYAWYVNFGSGWSDSGPAFDYDPNDPNNPNNHYYRIRCVR